MSKNNSQAGLAIIERMEREGAEIRTIEINNKMWYLGKDIAERFKFSKTSDMLRIVLEEDKLRLNYEEMSTIAKCASKKFGKINSRGMMFVNESAVYDIVMNSKLDSCKKFKKWVTHEVLPAIRKTGSYILEKRAPGCLLTTTQWLEVRNKARDGAHHLNLLAEYLGENRYWDIKHIRDHIYKCVFGESAKDLREYLELPELTNLRNYLNKDGLDMIIRYEGIAALLIESEMNLNQVRSNLSMIITTVYPETLNIKEYLNENGQCEKEKKLPGVIELLEESEDE